MPRRADTYRYLASRYTPGSRSGLMPLVLLIAATACESNAPSPTEPAPTDPAPAATSSAAVAALAFSQVSGGNVHTCGLTTDQRAYCWGYAEQGQLGTGSASGPENCIGAIGPFPCSTRPVPVTGAHRFRQISAGYLYTCAVTSDFRAYCWGSNSFGTIGDGTRTDRLLPVPVSGGLRFRQVDAGLLHTCGVSDPDRRVYCWGDNSQGQLGDGTRTSRLTPVPVFGGLSFRQVSTGNSHTCGVTTSDEAYCWGYDNVGQLGNDPVRARRDRPVLVAGGHRFRLVAAGSNHTCGVTTTKSALCWGNGGQIGDGQSTNRFMPRAVAGGLSFDRVTAGAFHTCGETATNRAYCWGSNGFGQLGDDGPEVDQLRPVAVAGGLAFAQLSAGDFHSCGITPSAVAYCWGDDFFGQLGHGNSGFGAESRSPVPVEGAT
jgi:alpha-tubulin suppressor-like RCC1 family protein